MIHVTLFGSSDIFVLELVAAGAACLEEIVGEISMLEEYLSCLCVHNHS